jgi:hypothetical protein
MMNVPHIPHFLPVIVNVWEMWGCWGRGRRVRARLQRRTQEHLIIQVVGSVLHLRVER